MEERLTASHDELKAAIAANSNELKTYMVAITAQFNSFSNANKERSILGNPGVLLEKTPPFRGLPNQNHQEKNPFPIWIPKLDFIYFKGDHPKEWIFKYEKFFHLYQILEEEQLDLAKLHLESKADLWYQSFKGERGIVLWSKFSNKVCRRLWELKGGDVIEEFKKLFQISSVFVYQEKFEELKVAVMARVPELIETYYISSFISGLQEDIKPTVKIHKPKSLQETFEIAH